MKHKKNGLLCADFKILLGLQHQTTLWNSSKTPVWNIPAVKLEQVILIAMFFFVFLLGFF